MAALDTRALFTELVGCRTRSDVLTLLKRLGDDGSAPMDQPFGPHDLKWVAFGGNPSNNSTIGLATKPGKSLTERITNAMDALLEERAVQASSKVLPTSPRAAAQVWFGRPLSGPDTGLFQGIAVESDKSISVVLLESNVADCPTVDVMDSGIGIRPDEMKQTILSLQAGNKIRKFHQIGSFGQGGSSTLGFSDYVLVFSRPRSDPKTVGFTVIRVLKLDATYKEDCYAYLVRGDESPLSSQLESASDAVMLYGEAQELKPPTMTKGTLVRHIGYRLSGAAKALGPGQGNLYHYLHYNLFDPLLPFRIWDLRDGPKGGSEYVGGSRNRLMKQVVAQAADEDKAGRIQVKHYRPMEYVVPSGSEEPSIGIEYWVVWAFKKGKEGEDQVLRSNSAELFVQPNHPIVGTLNGQTQGELTGHIFKEIGLGLLARHTIVHIDASTADSRIRRELFSTSREGFKDGPVLDSITSSLRRMLEEDEQLLALEGELTERLAKKDTATTREEVRQQVTRLLKEAGLQVSEAARADVEGRGDQRIVTRQRRTPYKKRDPLPTLPFPNVTFLRFASPDQHLEVHLQDSELVLVETDADAEFDKKGLVGVRSSDDLLEMESKSSLSGGRIRWRLRPSPRAFAGATGELTAFLTKPNGTQLSASVSFEVLTARERPSKPGKTNVPPFEIQAIDPSQEEVWGAAWPDDGDDERRQASHAYKADTRSSKTWVYYSTVYPPFASVIEKLKTDKPELVAHFRTVYEVWISYHAILQKQAEESTPVDVDEDKVEELMDLQRSVVASMQVKQALQFAEFWKKGLVDQHSA
jgi:hypothetical protein